MDIKDFNKNFSATESKTSVPFSNYTGKLVYDISFTADLILSKPRVKEMYAELANLLLVREGVRHKVLWTCDSFYFENERIASISFTDGKLCLQTYGGRYAENDRISANRVAKDDACRYAHQMINDLCERKGLAMRKGESDLISADDIHSEPFDSLIARGLIKRIRRDKERHDIYGDTLDTQEALMSRHGEYGDILGSFFEGMGKARLSNRLMLRSVDEVWVKAIEDCIPSLDELIRNPNHYIAESEDILPIEKTKRVSGRSIAHLCRHTDYISMQEDGDMTPTKMLNVFREDSLLTYENKFLNTLIMKLYLFVSRRRKIALEVGVDESLDSFEFENSFTSENGRGRVSFKVEYSEHTDRADVKNTLLTTGLWSRVERLNDIVTGYANSPFAKEMDRNYIRPPIMRTNAILKNKYFRECLALWEFIESYDDAGYGITVDEKTFELPPEYVNAAYRSAAVQYAVFRHNIKGDHDIGAASESYVIPELSVTEAEPSPYTESMVYEREDDCDIGDIEAAIRVALMADELYVEPEDDEAFADAGDADALPDDILLDESVDGKTVEFDKESFGAMCNELIKYGKENFVEIGCAFLRNDTLKMLYSRHNAVFMHGERALARLTFNERSMRLYVALKYDEIPKRFGALRDNGKKNTGMPSYIKIKSARHLEYAKQLADIILSRTPDADDGNMDAVYRDADIAHVSLGSLRDEHTAIMASDIAKLAVKEQAADRLHTTVVPDTSSADARSIASEISNLYRPIGNYDKPTEYGLDDTSAFIEDDRADGDTEVSHENT